MIRIGTRPPRLAPLLALALLLGACPGSTSPTTAPGKADAVVAVNARSAIDQTENLHVGLCTAAVKAHNAGTMNDDRYRQVSTACDAVAAAEDLANAELAVYLNTGTLTAQQALAAGMQALAEEYLKLLTAKAGG